MWGNRQAQAAGVNCMEQSRIRLGCIGIVLQGFQGQQHRPFRKKANQLLLGDGGNAVTGVDEGRLFRLNSDGFSSGPGIGLEQCFLALFLGEHLGGRPGLGFALCGALSAAGGTGQPDGDDHGEC